MNRALPVAVLFAGGLLVAGCNGNGGPAGRPKATPKQPNPETDPRDRMLDTANDAIRRDPSDPVLYTIRAATYRQMKKYDKAIADYTEAIRLSSAQAADHPADALKRSGLAARAYRDRGECYDAKKEPEKAAADYKEADRLDPQLLGPGLLKRIGKK
jgi:tetratricopeptide (TPR) repeat protein